MIIKVTKPSECPLLHFEAGNGVCSLKPTDPGNNPCNDLVHFPADCALHSRTIVIEKAEDDET
ncbi:MAG: hypothetical protein AMJ75_09315 [Phycisphaerae bacterium SM1_79]|nr:MAG: hypothetical protein AMJ75_09315 [Phycisphaerae bacterium SM1_79]